MSWVITSAVSRSFPWLQTTRLRVWVDDPAPFVYIDGKYVGVASYADMLAYPEIDEPSSSESSQSSMSSESSQDNSSSESFTPYYSSDSTASASSDSSGPHIYRMRTVDLLFRIQDDAWTALDDITSNLASLEDVLANVPDGMDQVLFNNLEESSSSASEESSSSSP